MVVCNTPESTRMRLSRKLLIAGAITMAVISHSAAVNPSCECILFDGFGYLSNGTFMSPNYPIRYDQEIDCLLYTFVGGQDEIVRITFDHLELQEPELDGVGAIIREVHQSFQLLSDLKNHVDQLGSSQCDTRPIAIGKLQIRCLDFVKLFLDLEAPEVNEDSSWQKVLCGNLSAQSLSFYSKGRALIFEFHSDSFRSAADAGFIGTFEFLKQSEFKSSGVKLPNTLCDYQVESTELLKRGSVFSPFYPYSYPSNSVCHYWFVGQPNQRVQVTLKDISLPQTTKESCTSTSTDYLAIYDGSGLTPLLTQFAPDAGDHYKPYKLGHYCGGSVNSLPDTLISTAAYLTLELRTGNNDKGEAKGFAVDFEFVNVTRTESTLPVELNDESNPCGETRIRSGVIKEGEISSPGYPRPYSSNSRCVWIFESVGVERVQLIFTDFDLYCPLTANHENSCSSPNCNPDFDHLAVYVKVNQTDSLSAIGTYCGGETPPQLMSSRNFLRVDFTANTYGQHRRAGFKAMWRFVTDFGITNGKQDNNHVCGFEFNSLVASNGTITSPNYPGLYPRNTDCVFTFRGKSDEKVRLSFTYFDVEGSGQCQNGSQSDYLEFSNYVTHDRKLARYCADRSPLASAIESEKEFYRLTFHSNGIFDGTGFSALYQFMKKEVKVSLKTVRSSSKGSSNITAAHTASKANLFWVLNLIITCAYLSAELRL